MRKVFIAWAIDNTDDSGVINCGEFASIEQAEVAVLSLGLEIAEIETEYRAA